MLMTKLVLGSLPTLTEIAKALAGQPDGQMTEGDLLIQNPPRGSNWPQEGTQVPPRGSNWPQEGTQAPCKGN